MCPYPLKVQAHPPRDQRLATQSRVLGREKRSMLLQILNKLRSMNGNVLNSQKVIYLLWPERLKNVGSKLYGLPKQ